VRFEVEEVFRGIPPGTKQVWVDPVSFTSCYAEYRLGERYLLVAQNTGQVPGDSAAMTIVRGKAKRKPLPPGIDPARPPVIYWAPECSGSRPADGFPYIEMDYAMLRAYRDGKPLPRVFGRVYLWPFRGWPVLNGPPLDGALVTLTGAGTTLRTTTRADGTFTLARAPAGFYSVKAELPPFVLAQPQTLLTVPEVGCGYQDVALRTTSTIEGVVLDHGGHPAAGIPVRVETLGTAQSDDPVALGAETDAGGRFAIAGIPDVDVLLSYGSRHPSSERVPYSLVYYRDSASPSKARTLRLRVGEQRAGFVLWLPPVKIRRVAVRALMPDRSPVCGAHVQASLHGVYTEFGRTNAAGAAELPCLEGLRYQLKAGVRAGSAVGSGVIRNRPVPILCGQDTGPVTLTLDHKERF